MDCARLCPNQYVMACYLVSCTAFSIHFTRLRPSWNLPSLSTQFLAWVFHHVDRRFRPRLVHLNLSACFVNCSVDPHNPVGIATSYGFDGPGIESLWSRDLPHLSRVALGPTHTLYSGYRLIPGCKAVGAWR